MKIYIIVQKNKLSSHSYILNDAYKDLNEVYKICYELNEKAQKSDDPFVRDDYYDISIVEVKHNA